MNILMTYDEVENCTFRPVVRSKMPKALQISKDQPNLLYGKPETNMQKKVDDYTASKEYKKALMLGYINKALKEFREGYPINAYKTLNKHFNLDQIRKFYDAKDPGPSPGTALYGILHPTKTKAFKEDTEEVEKVQAVITEENNENKGKGTANAGSKDGILRDVFTLAQVIEQHQRMIETQIKRIENSKKNLDKGESEVYGRSKSVGPSQKSTMCPLG